MAEKEKFKITPEGDGKKPFGNKESRKLFDRSETFFNKMREEGGITLSTKDPAVLSATKSLAHALYFYLYLHKDEESRNMINLFSLAQKAIQNENEDSTKTELYTLISQVEKEDKDDPCVCFYHIFDSARVSVKKDAVTILLYLILNYRADYGIGRI